MARTKTIEQEEQPLVNCLRKERVIARHIPRENSMIGNNPKHVLYGGMGENSTRTYVVPQLRSGQLVDVLTKDEKEFLENVLGLDDGALSVYKVENNYWKSFKVTLGKADNYLDLSNPIDYIKYKLEHYIPRTTHSKSYLLLCYYVTMPDNLSFPKYG